MLPGIVFTVLSRLPAAGEDGCRLWPGSLNSQGYGKATVRLGPKSYLTVYVHRVAYGWAHGWVPPELDHLCEVRACGESSHLEAVSHRENVARGDGRARERCVAGHLYAEVGWWAHAGGRKCKACHRRIASASYYRRRVR